MTAAVRLEGVSLNFGRAAILRDVSLSVEPGEVLALLGPSGSGKSSILRVVAGLYRPDRGRVWIDGADVTDQAPALRDIAMVFQNFALYPHLSVAANIATPLRLRRLAWWMRLPGAGMVSAAARTGLRTIDEEVEAAARLARVDDLLTRRPSQLSGGQKQRVAIARALVRRPKAFLLDEPFSSLDARLRESTVEEVRDLQRRLGVSTLFVTHDHAEAFAFADRIAVIFDGELIQLDTPQALYAVPKTRRVAAFIGSPLMNFAPLGALRGPHNAPSGATEIGIRPHHLRIVGAGHAAGAPLQGIVQKSTMNGPHILVSVEIVGVEAPWRATVASPCALVGGEAVGLTFDPEAVHFFDANGQRLAGASATPRAAAAFRPDDAA